MKGKSWKRRLSVLLTLVLVLQVIPIRFPAAGSFLGIRDAAAAVSTEGQGDAGYSGGGGGRAHGQLAPGGWSYLFHSDGFFGSGIADNDGEEGLAGCSRNGAAGNLGGLAGRWMPPMRHISENREIRMPFGFPYRRFAGRMEIG